MQNLIITTILAMLGILFCSCDQKRSWRVVCCRNESDERLWDATVILDKQTYRFGYVGVGQTASMGPGSPFPLSKVVIEYAFYPKDGIGEHAVSKRLEHHSDKLMAVADKAGEVELACKGEGRWVIRVYKLAPAPDRGELLIEEAIEAKDR